MRIVYDDTQQEKLVSLFEDYFNNKFNINTIASTKWNSDGLDRYELKTQLNDFLKQSKFEIGNTVTHAHGIGNNCQFPVYYHAKTEMQQCCYVNLNCGLFGEIYAYLSDYNNEHISHSYELRRYRPIKVSDRRK